MLMAGLAAAAGCGDSNPQATFDPDAGQHAAGWLPSGHAAAAGANIASCESCHGSQLDGGISGVRCDTCHIGGTTSAHPVDWAGTAILTRHGPYVVANSTDSCKNRLCHGDTLQGVAGSGPSCNNVAPCHSFP
jgi:hypothetical protein